MTLRARFNDGGDDVSLEENRTNDGWFGRVMDVNRLNHLNQGCVRIFVEDTCIAAFSDLHVVDEEPECYSGLCELMLHVDAYVYVNTVAGTIEFRLLDAADSEIDCGEIRNVYCCLSV